MWDSEAMAAPTAAPLSPEQRHSARLLTELLGCFLNEMARHMACPPSGGRADAPLAPRFMGKRYNLTITCQPHGLRRFVVNMSEPWPHTRVVGRLNPNGTARVFAHGVLLLWLYLRHEGLLDDFSQDLALALDAMAHPQPVL